MTELSLLFIVNLNEELSGVRYTDLQFSRRIERTLASQDLEDPWRAPVTSPVVARLNGPVVFPELTQMHQGVHTKLGVPGRAVPFTAMTLACVFRTGCIQILGVAPV